MEWALAQNDATGTAQVVLLALGHHVRKDGCTAGVSVQRLAEYVGLSDRQVKRILRTLEDQGLIKVTDDESCVDYIRKDRRPTVYELAMPRGDTQTSPRRPQRGDTQTSPRADSRGDISSIHGVTFEAPRGDIQMSPEPVEPVEEQQPPQPPLPGGSRPERTRRPSRARFSTRHHGLDKGSAEYDDLMADFGVVSKQATPDPVAAIRGVAQ